MIFLFEDKIKNTQIWYINVMFGLYMQAAVVFLSCSFWLRFLELSCAQGVCYADIYTMIQPVLGSLLFLQVMQ